MFQGHGAVKRGVKEEVCAQVRAFWSGEVQGEGTDVLAWWRENEGTLPHVARVARRYLAAPAGVADLERLFSRARKLSHYERKKLGFERALIFAYESGRVYEDHERLAREQEAKLEEDTEAGEVEDVGDA